MEIHFRMQGHKGEVGWYVTPSSLTPGMTNAGPKGDGYVSGGPLSYHTPHQQYDEQGPTHNPCEHYGGPCYMDGWFMAGGDLVPLFADKGDVAVWAELRRRYDELVVAEAKKGGFVDLAEDGPDPDLAYDQMRESGREWA